jgi:2-methylcitrate dehydratase PrpD
VCDLADRVTLAVDDELDARFPAECLARVTVRTADETYVSDVQRPRGARERPLSPDARREKVASLLAPTVTDHETVRDVLATPGAPIDALLSPWR